ncbi:kelch domain-containing protein 3-like [Scleropages formosus]|uniref:Kelch domain-containing protein 3-like n=1 Tax=Scleropages formosus TaxID=113540 RepID=A0A0P7VJ99_SCLFO|nr:kelch domain-containing protein 3-like [Scleropages formosus]
MLRWTVHLEGGPRRVNHAAVAVGHKVYSFGGYCSGEDYETLRQIDVHVFNAVSLRWMKLPPVRTSGREHAREVPYMRYGHTAVLVDDVIYLWGGRNDTEGACNVLYAFDVSNHRWFTPKVSGTIPGARDGHSACVLGKTMYIFGGYEQLADCFSNDIHKLDTTTMAWSLVNARGTPARWRDFHSATIIGTKMFVFGGRADRFGPFHSNNEIYCNKIKRLLLNGISPFVSVRVCPSACMVPLQMASPGRRSIPRGRDPARADASAAAWWETRSSCLGEPGECLSLPAHR